MSNFFDVRDAQNRGKHTILRRYAGAWAGIILNGLYGLWVKAPEWRRASFDAHLIYVDGFAGEGKYKRDADQPAKVRPTQPIWGSPIIGMQEIEAQAESFRAKGMPVRITGVINTKEAAEYKVLLQSLADARLLTPVVRATEFNPEGYGRIHVFNEDFRDLVPELMRWLPQTAFVLALVDPYGAVMDLERLGHLVARGHTDVITLFPFHDLAVRGGSSLKDEDARTSSDKGNVSRATAHFGTEDWLDIYRNTASAPEEREQKFVDLYLRQLRSLDTGISPKPIRYRLSGRDRTAYYLCLMTRDPDGTMKFNEILRKAAVEEKLEFWRDGEARRREQTDQGEIFDATPEIFAPKPEPYKPTLEEVEAEIRARVPAGATTLKAIYGNLGHTLYIPEEIKRALRTMKPRGEVDFENLNNGRSAVTVVKRD